MNKLLGAGLMMLAQGTPSSITDLASWVGLVVQAGAVGAVIFVVRLFLSRQKETEDSIAIWMKETREERTISQAAFQSQIGLLSTQVDQRDRQNREDFRGLINQATDVMRQVVSVVQALDTRVKEDQVTQREMQSAIRELQQAIKDLQEEVRTPRRRPS